jgi:hypothetical protein
MGIAGQNNCTWQTGHLSFDIVMFLLEQIASSVQHNNSIAAKDQEHQQEQPQHCLKIGIDASLIGFK